MKNWTILLFSGSLSKMCCTKLDLLQDIRKFYGPLFDVHGFLKYERRHQSVAFNSLATQWVYSQLQLIVWKNSTNTWFWRMQRIFLSFYLHIVWRVILYTVWFCMATVFIWSISGPLFYGSNLYVIGKENVLSLLSVIFVLCNRVQSSKITGYYELCLKIFSVWLTKCFNIFQYFFQDWLTDVLHIYWILTLCNYTIQFFRSELICTRPIPIVWKNSTNTWFWCMQRIFLSFLDIFDLLNPNWNDASAYMLSVLRFGWKNTFLVKKHVLSMFRSF